MTVFLDSSAVVKRYSDEAHAGLIRDLPGPLVISAVARVEVASAIWRKHRSGTLDSADAAVLVAAFDADVAGTEDEPPAYLVLTISTPVLTGAMELLARHPLRSLDAVQLSSAIAARRAEPRCERFASFDVRLLDAAAKEGFVTVGHA